jgi:hypothetical protein
MTHRLDSSCSTTLKHSLEPRRSEPKSMASLQSDVANCHFGQGSFRSRAIGPSPLYTNGPQYDIEDRSSLAAIFQSRPLRGPLGYLRLVCASAQIGARGLTGDRVVGAGRNPANCALNLAEDANRIHEARLFEIASVQGSGTKHRPPPNGFGPRAGDPIPRRHCATRMRTYACRCHGGTRTTGLFLRPRSPNAGDPKPSCPIRNLRQSARLAPPAAACLAFADLFGRNGRRQGVAVDHRLDAIFKLN